MVLILLQEFVLVVELQTQKLVLQLQLMIYLNLQYLLVKQVIKFQVTHVLQILHQQHQQQHQIKQAQLLQQHLIVIVIC